MVHLEMDPYIALYLGDSLRVLWLWTLEDWHQDMEWESFPMWWVFLLFVVVVI